MTSLVPPEFALPPLSALSFLPFLFLQAVLLHPVFPDSISRPLRIFLMIPALTLSAIAPFKFRFSPVHLAIGANFRWGIFGPYSEMKALEWGLAKDRTPYQWIGFDRLEPESSSPSPSVTGNVDATPASNTRRRKSPGVSEKESVPNDGSSFLDGTPKLIEDDIGSHGEGAALKSRGVRAAARRDSPATIGISALHLLTAMRGIGYAFGPPPHSLGPPAPRATIPFLRQNLLLLAQAHAVNTLSIIFLIYRHSIPHLLHSHLLPFLPLESLQIAANLFSYFLVGISLWAQMEMGQSGAALGFCTLTTLVRVVLPTSYRPAPFDSREWPPLFNHPFPPVSVTHFWSSQWHHLFRKPFYSVGYSPVVSILKPLVGKQVARIAGAYAVFALSSVLHDQGLWSARHGLPLPADFRPLTFTERWGGWIFFLSQGLGVTLEGIFARATGRKVRGRLATAFAYAWIIGFGLLAGRSWIALGLVRDLPPVSAWGWQRFILPSMALMPPPLWTH